MNDTLLNIIVAVLLVGFIVLIFFLAYRAKEKTQEKMIAFAQSSGWQVDVVDKPLITGLRFRGKQHEQNWTMEIVNDRNPRPTGIDAAPQFSHKTRWWIQSPTLPKATFVFGPKPSGMVSVNDLFLRSPNRNTVLLLMLGENPSWTSKLEPFTLGPMYGEVSKQYIGIMDDSKGTAILRREITSALSELPPQLKPVIILHNETLEIRLPTKELNNPSDLNAFVEFGLLLTDSGKS